LFVKMINKEVPPKYLLLEHNFTISDNNINV
jgi:hypothetical protein